jgi:hypothetical protein
MKESDLWDLLPPERPLPAHRRREIREALMTQIHDDLGFTAGPDPSGPVQVELVPAGDRGGARRRHRRFGPAMAAAVLVTVAAVAGAVALTDVTGSPAEDPPATVLASAETALAASSSALAESGRIDVHSRTEQDGELVGEGASTYRFAGDDRSHVVTAADGTVLNEVRVVGGEMYFDVDIPGLPEADWYHWVDEMPISEDILTTRSDLDPATLFDQLEAAGPFEEVGAETLDGVATRRLRATHPERASAVDLVWPGVATAIDLWIDDATGLVRRADATGWWDAEKIATLSTSVTFSDYGTPITIDVPPNALDVDRTSLG